MLGVDHMARRPARWHENEGMDTRDAVVITGLPPEEVDRRLRQMGESDDPKAYAGREPPPCLLAKRSSIITVGEPLAVSAEAMLLPPWNADKVCGIPNNLPRSALFGAVKRGPRQSLTNAPIPAVGGLTVRYTGKRLDQGDLDNYLGIMHYAQIKHTPQGEPIYYKEREFLRTINRSTGKSDRLWLGEGRTRLSHPPVPL